MPRLLLLAFALLAVPALAQSAPSWVELPESPFAVRHEDLFFVDEQMGWVVNGSGVVWRTLDGGATWSQADVLDGYLRAVGMASATKGWVGVLFSPTARLYETQDGVTFNDISDRIDPAISGGICGLWVVNEQVAYGVGQYSGPAYFIKTTDGGQTWTSASLSPHADTAVDVFFLDEQHGFVAAGTGGLGPSSRLRVLETTDGGTTWTVSHTSSVSGMWGWKLSFPTPEVGYVSAEYDSGAVDGLVLKTTDGGQTWTEVTIPGGESLQGVGFATPEVGWTSGRGTTSVTTDGGLTWAQIPLDGAINRFRFVGDIGYAGGSFVYKTDISALPVESGADPNATRLVLVAPNPAPGVLSVTYHLARTGPAEVAVYDVLGREVAVLAAGVRAAGTQVARWDGGAGLAPGTYLVRLRTEDGAWAQTVTVLRR